MAANITITGTITEVIDAARVLKLGVEAELAGVSPEVIGCLSQGDFIGAIKIHRVQTGASLRDSKNFIESLPAYKAAVARQVRG